MVRTDDRSGRIFFDPLPCCSTTPFVISSFFLPRIALSRWGAVLIIWGVGICTVPVPAEAQAPLHYADDNTTVRRVSFRFIGDQTFEASRLEAQIATRAPGFFGRLQNRFSFLPGLERQAFLFDPLTLQKDVVRLRRFYQQNGFPNPHVDYPSSQLDTTANAIHVIFTVQERAPLTIRELSFLTGTGERPLSASFNDGMQEAWTEFRDRSGVQPGQRYTEFNQSQIEDEVGKWLRNQGYAFADVTSEAKVDTATTAVTLQFLVDPGPLATVSNIEIEGNKSVSDRIVKRALPFKEGDRFSAEDVADGQRKLFDLNLFRVAIAEVPNQPADSTVTVRYQVREANLRSYSGQFGYGTQPGITLEGSWRHRNFQGNARTFIVGVRADTGYPEDPTSIFPFLSPPGTRDLNRLFHASVTLRQPYLFSEDLSGTIKPFVQERHSPSLSPTPDRSVPVFERLQLNEREFGLNTTVIYDFLPFRSISLQHSLARTKQFRSATQDVDPRSVRDDQFDKSVFSLSGTFGKADDFINPTKGFVIRPSAEAGGILFRGSGIHFVRLNSELSGYLPLSDNIQVAGRLFGGFLRPMRESRENLTIPVGASDALSRRNRTFQDRFSDDLFYAGGGSDVRGWQSRLASGKVLRDVVPADTVSVYGYRPIGARSKVGVNLEARLPFPGLGHSWRTAVFLDAAYLETGSLNLVPPPSVSGTVVGPDGQAVQTDPSQLLLGAGGGLRYETPFGFIRLDLAYKLTPDALDLRRPGDVGEKVSQGDPATAASIKNIRRFRLHFGIGRSF